MQIPILNGIFTDGNADFRTSYPVNLVPIPKQNGISQGYLRPADGLVEFATGPDTDRGGIEWNGICYRVMGTKLVRVDEDGTVTELGDVGGTGQVSMTYSFDRLAIASGGKLFYWNGTLTEVTDPDLGLVLDVVWVDGYFMTTDGQFLVVTELTDPTQVNPLKYGSSEVDPDAVKALVKIRNEIYAVNRHTIEVFDNIGGDFFPFQRIDGAQIQRGALGTHTCCSFIDSIAFLGSAANEAPGIYLGVNANTQKISNQEIDTILLEYTEAELSEALLEDRSDKTSQYLYIHLPDRTMVYDAAASQAMNQPVWFYLTSSVSGFSQYRAKNFTWCYDKWIFGDPTTEKLGTITESSAHHFGNIVRWEFGTTIVYNESRGALFHELELVSLTGRVENGKDPIITTSYSLDGMTWSQKHPIRVGTIGDRTKRLVWFQQGNMRNWRIQRFNGDSQAFISMARLEARIEPLAF